MFAFISPGPMQILFFFLVLVVWKSFFSKRNGFASKVLLGLALMTFIWLVLGVSYFSAQHPVANRNANSNSLTHPPQISTEQIWQHLTTPQIVLDNKTNEKLVEEIDLTEPEEPEPPRPAWVDLPPKQIGNVYRVAISSGPYKTKPECYHALEMLLGKEVQQRIEHLMPGAKIPDSAQLGITTKYILQEICNKNKTWVETTEASFGKMKQVHVQMEFTAATEKHLQTTFRNHQRQARVAKVGGIAGLGLGGLTLLYGLLKIANKESLTQRRGDAEEN